MKLAVITAFFKSHMRIKSFVESALKIRGMEEIDFYFVNTGPTHRKITDELRRLPMGLSWEINTGHIPYNTVMKYKMEVVSRCKADIVWMSDDDYIFHPSFYEVVTRIFKEHGEVEYLTLLKGAFGKGEFVLCGLPFTKSGSTMGGAFGTRREMFIDHLRGYFGQKNQDPYWDQGFWRHASKRVGEKHFIYMPRRNSLIQHVNFGSNYSKLKKDKDDHQGGFDFLSEDEEPWQE